MRLSKYSYYCVLAGHEHDAAGKSRCTRGSVDPTTVNCDLAVGYDDGVCLFIKLWNGVGKCVEEVVMGLCQLPFVNQEGKGNSWRVYTASIPGALKSVLSFNCVFASNNVLKFSKATAKINEKCRHNTFEIYTLSEKFLNFRRKLIISPIHDAFAVQLK